MEQLDHRRKNKEILWVIVAAVYWLTLRITLGRTESISVLIFVILASWVGVVLYVISPQLSLDKTTGDSTETFSKLKRLILASTAIFMVYFLAITIFTSKTWGGFMLNSAWTSILLASYLLMSAKQRRLRKH